MSKTIEQQRAAAAWEHVGATPSKAYRSLTQGAPVHIHTAGLGQTVAFYLSRSPKSNPEYEQLLKHLAEWVLPPGSGEPDPRKRPEDLMKAIQENDAAYYRRLMCETLAYLAWLKRFAAARYQMNERQTEKKEGAAEEATDA